MEIQILQLSMLLASQNITIEDGKRVTYDISASGASNRDLAFLLLAANQAKPLCWNHHRSKWIAATLCLQQ